MADLSVVVDESGGENGTSRYYLVTLVFHDQRKNIVPNIGIYERALLDKDLPNLPLHTSPLMYGKNQYDIYELEQRKKMLKAFFIFAKNLPIAYTTFIYKRQELPTSEAIRNRLSKDLEGFLKDHLVFFQQFDAVKIYYDNGQSIVTHALDEAFTSALSKEALVHRIINPTNHRLAQVADFLCAIELAAKKYETSEWTSTDNKFFGSARIFKQNWLKQLRRMRLGQRA